MENIYESFEGSNREDGIGKVIPYSIHVIL